jgi:hypothetical protein
MVGVLVGLLLLVSGGLVGGVEYATLTQYESTTGTVEHARIQNVTDTSGRSDLSLLGSAGEQLYEPNVTYTYTVNGERYTGANVAAGTGMVMGDRTKLAAALGDVQAGSQTVYYNPNNPGDAHLLQRLSFFPAGILVLCGLLIVADALTPRTRLIRLVTAWVPLRTLERVPGVDTAMPTGAAEDPTEILSAKRTWAGIDPAPFRGRAGEAVWVLCYLFTIDLVLAYFLLSAPPYDLWAVATAFVAPAGFARLGFKRVLG